MFTIRLAGGRLEALDLVRSTFQVPRNGFSAAEAENEQVKAATVSKRFNRRIGETLPSILHLLFRPILSSAGGSNRHSIKGATYILIGDTFVPCLSATPGFPLTTRPPRRKRQRRKL